MDLTPCRSCRKSVARDARTCPHCGAPNPTAKGKQVGTVSGCLIMIVALLVVMWLVS